MDRDREFWGIWKWDSPIKLGESAIEIDNDSRWNAWDLGMYDRREEAIQAALRAELPKPKPKPRTDARPLGALLLDQAKRPEKKGKLGAREYVHGVFDTKVAAEKRAADLRRQGKRSRVAPNGSKWLAILVNREEE
jgi:hypothetical protein